MNRNRRMRFLYAASAIIGGIALYVVLLFIAQPNAALAQGGWWVFTPTPYRPPQGGNSPFGWYAPYWGYYGYPQDRESRQGESNSEKAQATRTQTQTATPLLGLGRTSSSSSSSQRSESEQTKSPTPWLTLTPFQSSSSRSSSATSSRTPTAAPPLTDYRVIGWNDLGMHCMNDNFENLAVLPPYNTLWAQVIKPGIRPQIVTTGVTVNYSIIDNTYSAGKSNFWQFAAKLFPTSPAATQLDVGLTGARLAGQMHSTSDHFVIEGVPLTPYRDSAPQPIPSNWYPYQLAKMVVKDNVTGRVLAETTTVAPVSTEMRCDTCHTDGMRNGIATGNVETNILALHDQKEGTNLMGMRPILCATCHASNALGMIGFSTIPNLSLAMHDKHAQATNDCYLCHPGQKTQCLRDVMFKEGMTCVNCHGNVADVANPSRRPWIDEPRCGSCHEAKFAENPGKLYRNSTGHGGLYCEACHGSPHAILPTNQPNDNIQSIALQGHAGTIKECRVCHTATPSGKGPHGD